MEGGFFGRFAWSREGGGLLKKIYFFKGCVICWPIPYTFAWKENIFSGHWPNSKMAGPFWKIIFKCKNVVYELVLPYCFLKHCVAHLGFFFRGILGEWKTGGYVFTYHDFTCFLPDIKLPESRHFSRILDPLKNLNIHENKT